MKGDLLLYVVGQDQSLHFKQVFGVLEKLGCDWVENCHHISFGLYRFKDGKMSTRKGNLVFMKDVLDRAIEMAKDIIIEKNPELENKDLVSKQVGVGAVVFNDLLNDRVKNVEFDWDRVLDFEGDSGPYVQYGAVRCLSLIRKYGKSVDLKSSDLLSSDEETQLMITLLSYPDILRMAWESFKPNTVAQYLLRVCQDFNHFYNKHRIIGQSEDIELGRLGLVLCTSRVLEAGLKVLGVPKPERM
jgi:arginyl-tRNA synthetase